MTRAKLIKRYSSCEMRVFVSNIRLSESETVQLFSFRLYMLPFTTSFTADQFMERTGCSGFHVGGLSV